MRHILQLSLLFAASLSSHAGDWPQFLGPNRDCHAAADEKIAAEFPGGDPETVWSIPLGTGYSGPAIANGRVYIFHRKDDEAVLQALNVSDGKEQWQFSYATDYEDDFNFDDGPRATPLVADGRVYIFGAEGILHCISAADGKLIWKKDTIAEWPSEKGFFGRACSPMIAGGVLIAQIGGKDGAGIIGLDPASGEKKWQATNDEAGYASPVSFGKNVACFTREGFVLLDPVTGKIKVEKKHRASMHASVNAATPLVIGKDRVFLSACYDVGAAVWQVSEKSIIQEIWAAGDRLDCHFGTPVLVKDRLYGFHGRQEQGAEFRCIDATNGAVKWASPRLGIGHVIAVGTQLVILSEKGELLIHPTGGDTFAPTLRTQILGAGIRAAPAFAQGCIFARDKKQLVCVKLN